MVLWSTAAPSVGRVRFAPQGQQHLGFLEVSERQPDTRHVLKLDGLTSGTVYTYQVLADDRVLAAAENLRFSTALPANQGSFRAVIIGDSGNGSPEQLQVAGLIAELEPEVFLHTGDLMYGRTVDKVIFEPYRQTLSRSAFYPSRGNHDLALAILGIPWQQLFPPPPPLVAVPNGRDLQAPCCAEGTPPDEPSPDDAYFSFDWGSAHFAALDHFAGLKPCDRQMRWLCADLEAARTRDLRWLIVYLHEPIYNVGLHSVTLPQTRGFLRRLIDHYQVDLVLSGHDHNYQRSHPVRDGVARDAWQDPSFVSPRGTTYVVTGGGGAFLYHRFDRTTDGPYIRKFVRLHHAVELTITPTRLAVRSLTPEREVIDEFALLKGERPTLKFLRGDADFDGNLGIADAVLVLNFLFAGGPLECPVVADVDSSGRLLISDPVYLLRYLFLGGDPPAPPFPDCAPAPDADDAWCQRTGCAR